MVLLFRTSMKPTAREYLKSLSQDERAKVLLEQTRFYAIGMRQSRNQKFICVDTDEFTCIVPRSSRLGSQLLRCIVSLRGWLPGLYSCLRPTGECFAIDLDPNQPKFYVDGDYDNSVTISDWEQDPDDSETEEPFSKGIDWDVELADPDQQTKQAEKPIKQVLSWEEASTVDGDIKRAQNIRSKAASKPKKDG